MIPRSLLAVAAVLMPLAVVGAVLGQPTAAEKVARFENILAEEIQSREYHIDPAELLELMYDGDIDLVVFDVRPERDYNLFHLADSVRVDPAALDASFISSWPVPAVKVVVSNGEAAAEQAWRSLRAQGMLNVYLLAGGLNFWLDVYGGTSTAAPGLVPADRDLAPENELHYNPAAVNQPLDPTGYLGEDWRHRFGAALGDAYPAARPDKEHVPERTFDKKVVVQRAGPEVKGGCGG